MNEEKPRTFTEEEFKEINDKHDNPADVIMELLDKKEREKMNKYQKALRKVSKSVGTHNWFDDTEIDILQELVDKATPKKPKNIRFDNLRDSFGGKCECDSIVYEFHMYCPDCGQELDWSEENE